MWIIIAALLAVGQASTPATRQGATSPAGTRAPAEKHVEVKQAPAAPTPSPAEAVGAKEDPDSGKKTDKEDEDRIVRVSELPPVPVARDWVDHITWIATLLLVAIGAAGVGVGIETIKKINGQLGLMLRQTEATEKAASAAQKSADVAETAMQLLEAADILLESAGLDTSPEINWNSQAYFEFKNFGRTSAKKVLFSVFLRAEGMVDVNNTPPAVVVGAGATQSIIFPRFDAQSVFMPQEVIPKIAQGKTVLHYEATVTFEDIFDKPHVVRYEGSLSAERGQFKIVKMA